MKTLSRIIGYLRTRIIRFRDSFKPDYAGLREELDCFRYKRLP